MKSIGITGMLAIVFGSGGWFLEEFNIITEPAFWALYGVVFGVILSVVTGITD
ncbi:hypothetical protein [Nitrosomonas marina]|uniref:Uncharacterized protein n=1 Tax=Nitrosomonas marina TaxID=917 RepID=A0A1H8GKK4_9PROT|nr:hypothetical protein [Nitrosomonas marina]SEN44340.1 hypothetical protein SAMN05216325_11869 [Nitrosomonas marina]